MVRTYWFFPGFYEASGNLDLQPFARIDQIDARSPPCYVQPFYPAVGWRDGAGDRIPSSGRP
jgi:hypothetical protein